MNKNEFNHDNSLFENSLTYHQDKYQPLIQHQPKT